MKGKKTIWEFFIDNYKFTILLLISIIIFGIVSAVSLPKESDPEVDIPIAVITTPFIGASVEEVEELITTPIEDKISGIGDVDNITSVSQNGLSQITVEFNASADGDEVVDALKEKVDEVVRELPDDAEDPIVTRVNIRDQAFLILAISGPYDLAELTQYAEQIEEEIEKISGVSDASIIGGKERQIQVVINKAKLDGYGISISQVTQAIGQANSDIPIGSIETAGEEYTLRFAGRLRSAEDIEAVPVTAIGTVPVLVNDVAVVRDTYAKAQSISRLSVGGEEAFPAVSIAVTKSVGGDIVRMSDQIKERVLRLQQEAFPEDVTIESVQDVSEFIRQDLDNLVKNGIASVAIVVLLLMVFIGWRESLMAGFAIPLSFLITFIGLFYFGMTINFITLFALILALGILVDSAIVITEGLNKNRQAGKTPYQAAVDTIVEFEYPLISGTLTTVFAFLPMLLTGGIVGEYIKSIPITVTLVLMASLFVALAIIPTVSVVLFQRQEHQHRNIVVTQTSFQIYLAKLKSRYTKSLQSFSDDKQKRTKLKRLLVGLFFFSFALPGSSILRVEMFPMADVDYFGVDVEKPIGTPLEETALVMDTLLNEMYDDTRIKHISLNTGSTLNLSGQGSARGSHLGHLLVTLYPAADRQDSSQEIVAEYQQRFSDIDDATITVSQQSSGPPGAAPVEITLTGNDLNQLDQVIASFTQLLSSISGTTNVRSDVVETNGQFVMYINRVRAQQFGVSAAQVAMILRNVISGISATEITLSGDDVDVVVKYALNSNSLQTEEDTAKTDISTIESLSIATPSGDIPLGSFVDITLENSRQSIRHEDGERVLSVKADVTNDTTPLEVFDAVRKQMDDMTIPSDIRVTLGGENEDTQESFADMLRAMILSIVLIAALLVLQFRSYRQSLLILITIPLALIGVFPGLLIMNQPISFPGVIGIVALVGIVVNNAIILIDRINSNRREGKTIDLAIIEAGESRLEPIILTTITTVVGILPLAITQAVWASLGYAIVYGLLFSTVTTLYVIPILYKRLHRKEEQRIA